MCRMALIKNFINFKKENTLDNLLTFFEGLEFEQGGHGFSLLFHQMKPGSIIFKKINSPTQKIN
ncbi:unnamed protein product, partial [marine sediment metagenome]